MRWKLLRRRLSISAPRVIVRRHLPWPLRWAVVALVLGFSGAIALWAFELGKELAGLDRHAKAELTLLRDEVGRLRMERDQAQSLAHAADSLLKSERAAQDKLGQQLRQLEAANMALQADLGFFEKLLPAGAGDQRVLVRGLQVEPQLPGRLRYQLLLMQSGKQAAEFAGRVELTLAGTLDGRPWMHNPAPGPQALRLKQYARIEGVLEHPPGAVVKTVQVKVTDASGAVRVTQTTRL
ncbi:hypothetical protein HLB44_06120 [Aquincola sp. S2]|uniref:Uncharacterized protein n=1 Tax=Pseudaquabacterium terrae TaxID=2732868 RepID=A0ABX2EDA2_9BURK|nr:DUF6776 family protein [Aquabacterium terrae]NRF66552.1 hypothetical protein [Aquabacterium terrae]